MNVAETLADKKPPDVSGIRRRAVVPTGLEPGDGCVVSARTTMTMCFSAESIVAGVSAHSTGKGVSSGVDLTFATLWRER